MAIKSDEGEYGIKWFTTEGDAEKIGVCEFTNQLALFSDHSIEILQYTDDLIVISEEEDDLVCNFEKNCYCDSCPYCTISTREMLETHSDGEDDIDELVILLTSFKEEFDEKLHKYEEVNGEFEPGIYVANDSD